jgi:hypothetical protein
VLRQRAQEVQAVDDDVLTLVDRMFTTMYAAEGQGLAAPQVDVSRRIAVVDVPPHGGTPYVLINPTVVAAGEAMAKDVEGCLSIPGVWDVVARPAEVTIEALDARLLVLHAGPAHSWTSEEIVMEQKRGPRAPAEAPFGASREQVADYSAAAIARRYFRTCCTISSADSCGNPISLARCSIGWTQCG